jgi:hypothetical protein
MGVKTKHGGSRNGSGRKNQNKVRVSYRLAHDVAEYLKNHKNPATSIIEEAVRIHMSIEGEIK